MGQWGRDPPGPASSYEGQIAQIADRELSWHRFAQRTLGSVANPKGCSEKEAKQCEEETKAGGTQRLPSSHSFLFPTLPPCPLCQNYLSSHVLDVTRRMIWFLGFSLYQWAGNSSQTKTRHHQRLPCGPPVSQTLVPGLDWATKKAGELWWAQPPVHFIFILFPFPFDFEWSYGTVEITGRIWRLQF